MASPAPYVARFRFYGSLRDFLPGRGPSPQTDVRYTFRGRPVVKDAIEAQGVPHPEVGLVLANGTPVDFDHPLRAGDRVSVYPWIQSLPRPVETLRPSVPTPPQFVCDVHLGQLARYLRMLGLDTRYAKDHSDSTLAQIADEETRILLTRDVELLKRSRVTFGAFVRAQAPRRQLRQIVERFDLAEIAEPLSRCLGCNAELEPAPPAAIDEQVPPRARAAHDQYAQCPECESVYWAGTHVERMRDLIEDVTASA